MKRPINLTISEEARSLLDLSSSKLGLSCSAFVELLIRDYSQKNNISMITLTVKTSQGKILGAPVSVDNICDLFTLFTQDGYEWWSIKDEKGILDASYTTLNIGPDDSNERLLRALKQREFHPEGDLI